MKRKVLWITIDSLVRLLRDYCGTELVPEDAMPVKLQIHPSERLFAVVVEGESIPMINDPMADRRVVFDIKRVFGVGGADNA